MVLSQVLGDQSLPRWVPLGRTARPHPPGTAGSWLRLASLAILILLLGVLLMQIAFTLIGPGRGAGRNPSVPIQGCAPDLPNDHCR